MTTSYQRYRDDVNALYNVAVGDEPTWTQRQVTRGFAEAFGPVYALIDASLGHPGQYPRRKQIEPRQPAYYAPRNLTWDVDSTPTTTTNVQNTFAPTHLRRPFRYRRNQRIRMLTQPW